MDEIEKEIEKKFGGKLRVRVNGVLVEEDRLLMIRHQMNDRRSFWNVPGGGMDYGSSMVNNLSREFVEETGLEIEVIDFLCVSEFLKPPLHAVELFFEVESKGGLLTKGIDPELAADRQIIKDFAFLNIDEIKKIKNEEKHHLFWELNSFEDIRNCKGYFNFGKKCIK